VSFALGADSYVETLRTTDDAGTAAIDLTGNRFDQTIIGNDGANIIEGGGGADILEGRGGNDTYFVDGSEDAVVEAVTGGDDLVAARASYVLGSGVEVETLRTTSNDGTAAVDLTGNEFGQTIVGNTGDNRIDGKGGSDTLRGLAGDDTFVFSTALAPDNVDHIVDFNSIHDTIELSQAIFSVLPAGGLAASAFHVGTGAVTADQHIIYDSAAGTLYYDADGNGSGAAVSFATLATGLALAHGDFVVA
jgi:Ca2+-binding RTX toxin-like protein